MAYASSGSSTSRLVGADTLIRGIETWGAELKARVADDLEGLGESVKRDLEARAPVSEPHTGHPAPGGLRSSVRIRRRKDKGGLILEVVVTAPHAHLVEFGHQGPMPAPPHPFFLPVIIPARRLFNRNLVDRLSEPAPGWDGRPTVTVTGGTGI